MIGQPAKKGTVTIQSTPENWDLSRRMENGEWRMKLARKHRHSTFSIDSNKSTFIGED